MDQNLYEKNKQVSVFHAIPEIFTLSLSITHFQQSSTFIGIFVFFCFRKLRLIFTGTNLTGGEYELITDQISFIFKDLWCLDLQFPCNFT